MATRSGLGKWFPDFFKTHRAFTVFDLLVDYIKSGRIKLDKTKFTKKTTYHDPCNYGRKSLEKFGHGYFDEPRWILDQFITDMVYLYPSRENEFCCGGGGGTLLTPYKDVRLFYGQKKIEQIKRTKAELLIVPCHSCHSQIKTLIKQHKLSVSVKYLWEVVADALIIE